MVGGGDKNLVKGWSLLGRIFLGRRGRISKFLAGGGDSLPVFPVGKTLSIYIERESKLLQ